LVWSPTRAFSTSRKLQFYMKNFKTTISKSNTWTLPALQKKKEFIIKFQLYFTIFFSNYTWHKKIPKIHYLFKKFQNCPAFWLCLGHVIGNPATIWRTRQWKGSVNPQSSIPIAIFFPFIFVASWERVRGVWEGRG
jgi:hypothetical protein